MPPSAGQTRSRRFAEPQLQAAWEPRWRTFVGNLGVALRGPSVRRRFGRHPYFNGGMDSRRVSGRAFLVSVVWHVLALNIPFLLAQDLPQRQVRANQRNESVWYLPPNDLPVLTPANSRKARSPRPPAVKTPKALPKVDAFHARQTIISAPLRPTHPRQTLIQPDSPPAPPKILPPLPNIVQWSDAPSIPKPQIHPTAVAGKNLRAVRQVADDSVAAPELSSAPLAASGISLAAPTVPNPRLTVAPLVAPPSGSRPAPGESATAPDVGPGIVGNDRGLQRLVALSANPAPPIPAVLVPPGNLEATFTISPAGSQPSAPATPSLGEDGGSKGGANGGNGGAQIGPPGISISGGGANSPASPSSTTMGATADPPVRPLPAKPQPRLDLGIPARAIPSAPIERVKPGSPAEEILGRRRIYTLHVNMPNLTSVTGSWVLRFVEFQPGDIPLPSGGTANQGDELAGPVPLRKVDPKYPPALISARIQGDVVLYAIIRKDGTVDSIQLVKGLEPQLDLNAMEALARWRFEPAKRSGAPVELEAVIQIPFRYVAPL